MSIFRYFPGKYFSAIWEICPEIGQILIFWILRNAIFPIFGQFTQNSPKFDIAIFLFFPGRYLPLIGKFSRNHPNSDIPNFGPRDISDIWSFLYIGRAPPPPRRWCAYVTTGGAYTALRLPCNFRYWGCVAAIVWGALISSDGEIEMITIKIAPITARRTVLRRYSKKYW